MTQYRPILTAPGPPIAIAEQPSPMLQWVEIAAMVIDDAYQRPINHGGWVKIRQIAANFRWSCFTPVLLAPVDGGQFAVIDGQHRVHAASMCGVKSVPCMVVPIAVSEQAKSFMMVNTVRTGVSQFALYKAGLASGEAWAIAARDCVAAAGCTLMSFTPSSKNRKPFEVLSIALVRGLVDAGHASAVTTTLMAIRAIDAGGASIVPLYSDWLLNPLMKAVAQFPDIDADDLVAVLRKRKPFQVIEVAQKLARDEHRPVATAARDAFVILIRGHLMGVAA